MENNQSQLPLEIQLQVVCTPRMLETYDLLTPLLPELKEWNPKHGSHDLYKERVKKHLNFTASELVKYLEIHPEICETLLNDSYDKRYTPSTFIEQKQDKYRVGWVPSGQSPINQIRVFSSFAEAATDYVLFSWGFPRLTAEQANWVEVEHY
jgi:hypothetical protein